MPRDKATTIVVDEAIALYVSNGETSQKRIHTDLVHRGLITTRDDGSFTVSEKTVGRRIHKASLRDLSGQWSFAVADPKEARLVLDVLGVVVRQTKGRIWFSKDLAGWVARVREAAPTMPPEWVYVVARSYQWARANNHETHGLDLVLVAAPWESAQNAVTWTELLRNIGEQAGGWPGGGPGLMALAAQWPPPDWAARAESWGALLWVILTEGIETAVADAKIDEVLVRRLRREPHAEAVDNSGAAAESD